MRKSLKRTMIAGAGTLAIVVPFFGAEAAATNVDRAGQQIAEQATQFADGGHCYPLGPHGGVACYPW